MSAEGHIPAKLLLVDDQPSNLKALQAILEPLGATLVLAASGKEALKHVLANDFAAIMLDVQMPEMDGFETASLIRSRERSRSVPIIFLTAISKDERFVLKGYTVGAVDYLTKPFDPEVLRSKIAIFIELFRKNAIIQAQSELLRVAKEKELDDVRRASDERYLNLAESMPQIVWASDHSGALKYCNQRWSETAGVRKAHPEWSDILSAEDRAAFKQQWAAAVKAKREWSGEFRFGSAARSLYRWHLVRALPVRGPDDVTTWIGTCTDIHDRREAEEALRLLAEASTLLGASLDSERALEKVALRVIPLLGDACFIDVCSEDRKPRRLAAAHANGPMARSGTPNPLDDDARLSVGPANVILTGDREVVLDVAKEAADALERGARGEAASARGTELLRFLVDLRVSAYMSIPIATRGRVFGAITLFHAASGRAFGAEDVALAEDVARRAAVAMDNARLLAVAEAERAKLEEANRAKDVFLATLSHELRTPLNAMMGWTQILRTGKLDEAKFRRAVDTIDRNAKAQAQLIADLLDVSRIVTGKLKLDALSVDLAPIMEGAVDAARPAADAKKLTLEAKIDAQVGEVRGDPVRLAQIVGNLVSNAIKFTPSGGTVSVTLERHDSGEARLTVADSGQGIPSEFLPYVFDRFRQADSTTTRAHGGLGLGLAIVKHLVELQGGTVSASSPGLGKGASFVVALPIARSTPMPTRERAASTGGATGCVLSGLHVVLVEDDDDGRELIETMLAEAGARVTSVGTSADALETIKRERPDVLVSDIGLPGEDGFALIQKVRALPGDAASRLPAVALTAYASREDTARALAAGFHAHVPKPVTGAELAAAVVAVLARVRREGAMPAAGVAQIN